MKIIVNGKDMDFDGSTVADVLSAYKIDPLSVVVEKNRMIVHRERYFSEEVLNGDVLEIVRIVGGG